MGDNFSRCITIVVDEFVDGSAGAGAKIVNLDARLDFFESSKVTFGKVYDVNIVADTSAVDSLVVVTKNLNFGQVALSDTGNVWRDVIGDAVGAFANEATFVGTDRVKIAEKSSGKIAVSDGVIFDDLFDHVFGPTVWIGDAYADTAFFGERESFWLTIDCG